MSADMASLQRVIDNARRAIAKADLNDWICGYWYGVVTDHAILVGTAEAFQIAKDAQGEIDLAQRRMREGGQ